MHRRSGAGELASYVIPKSMRFAGYERSSMYLAGDDYRLLIKNEHYVEL